MTPTDHYNEDELVRQETLAYLVGHLPFATGLPTRL